MVNVDECLIEKAYCEASCSNHLIMKNASAPVFTNTTSFIGINAYVNYSCECVGEEAYCSNSGMLSQDGRYYIAESFFCLYTYLYSLSLSLFNYLII